MFKRIFITLILLFAWGLSYFAVFLLSYNSGHDKGMIDVGNAFHYVCRTTHKVTFYGDPKKFYCNEVKNL